METVGQNVCPVCKREFMVTPQDDVFVPACGCFGVEVTVGALPCEDCGMAHARSCPNIREQRTPVIKPRRN